MTRRAAVVTAAWVGALAVIAVSVVWGRALQRESPEIFLGAAPLVGRDFSDGWDWRVNWSVAVAAMIALATVALVVSSWWWRAPLHRVGAVTAVSAAGFAVALAAVDGRDGILYGAEHPTEYLANLPIMPPPGDFVRTFVERIDDYSVHVRGHPPGFALLLQALDGLGLATGWVVASLSIAATAALPAAVLVTVRTVADDEWARRVAPTLVVAPYAIWMVTSADAVYTAVGAWGVAATALALRSTGRGAVGWGVLAGTLLGGLLFFTYGGATFVLVPLTLVVASARRQGLAVAPSVGAAVSAGAVVTVAFAVAGFWWFAGAAETRLQYWAGTAQFRPWSYFAIANLAVALVALGPLTFAGAAQLRDRRIWLLVGGSLAALVVSHVSQYSKAEVERIWLLFYPWIAVAGAALVTVSNRRRTVVWLGAQAGCAIVLQAALVSKW
jgi:methylthioxylose transferase